LREREPSPPRDAAGDGDLKWLAVRIAMLDVDFEVHEPPELVDHVRALGSRRRLAARAGASVSER
jgi:hypothetical protein